MVRPRMAPLKRALSFLRMTKGSSQLLVGPAVSLEREQMKVRSSTRATSLGAERARKQPGQSFSLSLVKVPAWTSWLQRKSYSACEPSIQWMRSGWQRSAIFSTQRMRCLLVVGGAEMAASGVTVFIGRFSSFLFNKCSPLGRGCQINLWGGWFGRLSLLDRVVTSMECGKLFGSFKIVRGVDMKQRAGMGWLVVA